ncbi:MAG TPA: OmpA family protein [Candidatus Solibacter sp.]|nr:OmpA family protein [Candidatus Solibacter sp.]
MNRIVVALLLSLALSLPLLAQSSSSGTSGSTQAAQTAGPESISEPIPAPTSTNFWDGDDPNVVNLVTHPFANKKYVERLTGPIKSRLNELDEITNTNRDQIKDVDARATKGLQLASEKVSLADQHSADANTKAQSAQSAATQASTHVAHVEQLVGNLDQYKGTAQTEIRFRPGQSVLSKQAKDALDEMAASLKDQRSYIIEVRGYSAGSSRAATANSQKMADSVVRYLVLSHNIPVYRVYELSMGNMPVEGTAAKRTSGGRVEVSVMKNDMVAQQ